MMCGFGRGLVDRLNVCGADEHAVCAGAQRVGWVEQVGDVGGRACEMGCVCVDWGAVDIGGGALLNDRAGCV